MLSIAGIALGLLGIVMILDVQLWKYIVRKLEEMEWTQDEDWHVAAGNGVASHALERD